MAGGLLALLDDVAAIARLAATQLDDVAAQAAKAGSKAAGVVIDDAAVTPKYVTGLPAARELPIVWKIARASFFNKLVILLPVALLLDAFAPWLLVPLLMLGGAYLCYEGAEKVWHWIGHHEPESEPQKAVKELKKGTPPPQPIDAAHLEKTRVAGAIKTDFILSAEITAITLAAIESDSLVTRGVTLAVVAIAITAVVYGTVALLVKADDVGLSLAGPGRPSGVQALGRGIVAVMPTIMTVIATVGTAAMLWVGGNIIVHGLHELGVHGPYDVIHGLAVGTAEIVPAAKGFAEWLVTAALDGVLGLLLGLLLIPIVGKLILPLFSKNDGKAAAAH